MFKELFTCEGCVEMDIQWQLCRTIGPLTLHSQEIRRKVQGIITGDPPAARLLGGSESLIRYLKYNIRNFTWYVFGTDERQIEAGIIRNNVTCSQFSSEKK